jgi:subtilisin family serine protease
MTDYVDSGNGHGTRVASLAGGLAYSAAPKADLFLIKYRNAYSISLSRGIVWFTPQAPLEAFQDGLWKVLDDIFVNGKRKKAVVNMSWGM